jgi:hypothetical protein
MRGVLLVAVLLAACDSPTLSFDPTSTQSPADLTGAVVITLAQSGAHPAQANVPPGGRVAFANNTPFLREPLHDGSAGPCPELDVGRIEPGRTVSTVPLGDAGRTCGFYDALDPGNPAFHGLVVIGP